MMQLWGELVLLMHLLGGIRDETNSSAVALLLFTRFDVDGSIPSNCYALAGIPEREGKRGAIRIDGCVESPSGVGFHCSTARLML
jgi:hypothetical protein